MLIKVNHIITIILKQIKSPDIVLTQLTAYSPIPPKSSPIKPCGKCVTCNKGFYNIDPHFDNKVTGVKFDVTENLTCTTSSIVY